ncbi:hypothetical protein [Lutibacter maritimus]|uniref:Uncharacterized protein n=1 Tax=Lutibacter maritimus TaxID=593133 RepID=A0A1I6NRJ3_9FLAO|nr:hypothetical protein [Lutibacter maritimus]SFS30523.1 hypothetical protein SAMN04488006_0448 [Lutibacter maritimus]
MNSSYDIMELWSKPTTYKFSSDEIAFIKKHTSKNSYKVKYALYNKHSSQGKYIAFIIDSNPNATRKSGMENFWTYIAEREITIIEYDELIANFGCNNRRFQVWYYKSIDHLILDDLKYSVKTPERFVKVCKEKGYTLGVQLKMELKFNTSN